MSVTRIPTESPKEGQWRLLSPYMYPANINRYLVSNNVPALSESDVTFVASCFQQGRAYFTAAEAAPPDISPLLYYYGATNLLAGAAAMRVGRRLPIDDHGMRIDETTLTHQLHPIFIKPVKANTGALQLFCNAFSSSCSLVNGGSWSVGEIFGSIPDLLSEYLNQYNQLPSTLPVQEIQREGRTFDRIPIADVGRYGGVQSLIERIDNYGSAYLGPQDSGSHLILNRKVGGVNIGVYSITGRKHLHLSHDKQGKKLTPNLLIMMLAVENRLACRRRMPRFSSVVAGDRPTITTESFFTSV